MMLNLRARMETMMFWGIPGSKSRDYNALRLYLEVRLETMMP